MTTTLNATADDDRCQTCSARATSCDIRRWLSGRSCCTTCAGPHTHRGEGDSADPRPPEHHDHDRDLVHLEHLEHEQQGGHQ